MIRRLATVLAAALPLAAQAVMLAGPGGTAEQGRRMVLPTPGTPPPAAAAPALDLVSARLDAVDSAAGRVVIRGQSVPLHPQALRVIGPGGQVLAGAGSLAAGQSVRFALEPSQPGTARERRIVLIFIDR